MVVFRCSPLPWLHCRSLPSRWTGKCQITAWKRTPKWSVPSAKNTETSGGELIVLHKDSTALTFSRVSNMQSGIVSKKNVHTNAVCCNLHWPSGNICTRIGHQHRIALFSHLRFFIKLCISFDTCRSFYHLKLIGSRFGQKASAKCP